jgi:hypothetical protein
MRQTISGVAAAIAVMTAGAAPAMACGFAACSPCGQTYSPCAQVYTPPVVNTGCNTGCGGWGYARLAEPTTQYQYYAQPTSQYYYVNQGPTYTGPGAFGPYPTNQEEAVSGWGAYRHHPHYYGYEGGRYADATTHYDAGAGVEGPAVESYRWHHSFHYRPWHHGYRYGYAPHHHYAMRYGYTPYHYGHRVLRRYY